MRLPGYKSELYPHENYVHYTQGGLRYPYGSIKSVLAHMMLNTLTMTGHVSKKYIIRECVKDNQDWLIEHSPFRRNLGNGATEAKSNVEQVEEFTRTLSTIWPVVVKHYQESKGEYKEESKDEPGKCDGCGALLEPGKSRCLKCAEVKVTPKNPVETIIEWCKEKARPMCERRAADGNPLEEWSMRKTIDAARLVKAGCPIEAVQDSCTMDFPSDARAELRVKDFDFVHYGILRYLTIAVGSRHIPIDGQLVGSVPMFLIGPAGTGKSTICRMLADTLELPYGFVSMSMGTPPSAFYGRPKIGGDGEIVESEWTRIYDERNSGGIYLLDEIDAAESNLLTILNAALANGRFSNPATGEAIIKHNDTIPIAAGNTLGLGADRNYVGREKLDHATLDRFAAGRVRMTLDRPLEHRLALSVVGGE